jgi:hypothetical protein
MIMTSFTQRSKSVNFFQTTDFSNIDINFINILLMFVQISQKLFQRRNFIFLYLNSSVHRYVYFPKTQADKFKEKSKIESKRKRKQKENMYIIYKGCYQAKYLFRA